MPSSVNLQWTSLSSLGRFLLNSTVSITTTQQHPSQHTASPLLVYSSASHVSEWVRKESVCLRLRTLSCRLHSHDENTMNRTELRDAGKDMYTAMDVSDSKRRAIPKLASRYVTKIKYFWVEIQPFPDFVLSFAAENTYASSWQSRWDSNHINSTFQGHKETRIRKQPQNDVVSSRRDELRFVIPDNSCPTQEREDGTEKRKSKPQRAKLLEIMSKPRLTQKTSYGCNLSEKIRGS